MVKKKHIEIRIIIGLLFLCGAVSAAELNWTSGQFVLGSSETIGRTLDLKSSGEGNFHLSISNDYQGSVWYGKWEEPTWTVMEHAVTVGSDSFFEPELALSGEYPIIMYNSSETLDLHSIIKIGSTWSDPQGIYGADHVHQFQMLVDAFGVRHIVYLRVTTWGKQLMYGTDLTGSWQHEQIAFYDSDIQVHHFSLAVDSERRPHFVWAVRDAGTINYAVRTGTSVFESEVVSTGVWCLWMEMVMLDGDIPYFAFVDAPSNYMIKDRYKIGNSFYGGTVANVSSTDVIYDVGMAVAVEEGILVSNLYYVFATYSGLNYAHYQGGWHTEPIEDIYLGGVATELTATWDGSRNAVGLALTDNSDSTVYFALGYRPSDPTATPNPAGTPTPTPSPDPSGSPTPSPTPLPSMDLVLDLGPDQDYNAGELMECYLRIRNPGAARDADVYVLLEVYGEFWFGPGWTHDLNHYTVVMDDLDLAWIEYIPEFILPDPLPSGGPFYFHAAAFSPDTLTVDTLVSNIDTKTFSFL